MKMQMPITGADLEKECSELRREVERLKKALNEADKAISEAPFHGQEDQIGRAHV